MIADRFGPPRPPVGTSSADSDARTLEFVVRLDASQDPPRIGREVHLRVELGDESP